MYTTVSQHEMKAPTSSSSSSNSSSGSGSSGGLGFLPRGSTTDVNDTYYVPTGPYSR